MPKKGYFAVTRGLTPGIYQTYAQVLEQITGFDYPKFKKFENYKDAYAHLFHTRHNDVSEKEKITEEFVANLKEALAEEQKTKEAAFKDSSHGPDPPAIPKIDVTSYNLLGSAEQDSSQNEGSLPQATIINIENETLFLNFEEDAVMEPVRKSTRLKSSVSYKELSAETEDYTLEDFEKDLLQLASGMEQKPGSKKRKIGKRGRPKKEIETLDTGEMFSKDGVPVIYTDGCCTNSNKPESDRKAGCGVYWGRSDPRNVTERLWGAQTNQRAELWAVVRGVQSALQSDYEIVEIRTDSRYVIEAMTNWICTWKKNDWKTVHFQPVKNKDIFVLLDNLCLYIEVRLVKVKAHSSDTGNDMADMLAKCGANLSERKIPSLEPTLEHKLGEEFS